MLKTKDNFNYRGVFDNFTIKNIEKLISRGSLDYLIRPIKVGKESNIFLGENINDYVAVKIYRWKNCNFNRMYDYLIIDPRISAIRKTKQKIVLNWAKREYANLKKAFENNVSVPRPLDIINNVLMMDFIGDKQTGQEALQLKDYGFKNKKQIDTFYKKLMKNLKNLIKKAGLVHSDLSEFNILVLNNEPIIIDMSQSIPITSYKALYYLKRDFKIINKFFYKNNIKMNNKLYNELEDFIKQKQS